MRKILYVEDELAENVKRILALFEPILGGKLSKQLDKLDDPYDKEVKKIVEQSKVIDVCYTFSDALKKIKENYLDYDLFIIDRDLSEDEYSEEQIRDIIPEFTEDIHIKYLKREGDYLFSLLRGYKIDYDLMVYFLTANNNDSLKCQDEMAEPALSDFNANNIKNKREPEDIKQLSEIITNNEEIMIRIENPEIFMLENCQAIRVAHSKTVISVLNNMKKKKKLNKEEITKELGSLRIVITGLLNDINNVEKLHYFDPVKDKPSERDKINWLEGGKNKEMRAILKPYCDYVYTITSELCLHDNDNELVKVERTQAYQAGGLPTIHTLHSAICAIKDIFKWIALNVNK